MANYRITKGTVGPWPEGTVITDNDLKANPGLGGTDRLRDRLGVIEDTSDDPTGNPDDVNSPARAAQNTTGSPSRQSKRASDAFAARAGAPGANPGPNAGNAPGTPGGGPPPAGNS